MAPFDVVLRICPFPAAWLPGQRSLPISRCRALLRCASRHAFGDLPKRVDRCLASCRALSRLLTGIRSVPLELRDGRGEAVAPEPACGKSAKGLVSMPVQHPGRECVARFVPGFHAFLRARPGFSPSRRRSGDRPPPPGAMRALRRSLSRRDPGEISRGSRRQGSGEPADLLDLPRPASASSGLFSARPEGVTEVFASEAVFARHVDVRP